ncbi:flagellar FlbD family protein [Clostridiisalibacter paucivorans]|uniref:flagellar FlbD family protein n=1 Tax=Clostridiisalibacter paucivorans TaxID=408753 RepID=UPI000479C5F2|nr:flagellar FlbD family protein [Clostridiisalibacter paucivorans]
MIKLRRMNGKEFIINADLIELVEETPNTVIKLTTGNRYVVKESADEIIDKITCYKRRYLIEEI